MRNIFKKISVITLILAIFIGPMTTFAADMILYGISGSGTWESTKNGNTFEGDTTDPDNNSAKGTWNFDGFSGNWTGEIKGGKILNGTLNSSFFAPKIPSGNWVGGGSKKNESIVTSTVVIGDTYANLSGNYLEGYFTKVYFKYGEDNASSIKTLGKVLQNTTQKTTYATYNEDITGLKSDGVGYYYIFCGEKNGQETCGESLNFKTQKKDWNNIDNTTKVDTKTVYTYLAPLGEDKSFDSRIECAFADYANKFIKIFIGICALLAMVMIISGGIQYMTSELVSSEVQGKTVILQAVFGLILAVSGYAILNTINPKLLDLCIDKNLPQANIEIEEQIKGRLGGGKCEVPTDKSNPCHPSNLTSFGPKADQAAAICNGESGGGKYLSSALDKGSDGNSFSFGLFQINIIAHGDKIGNGQICKNIFKVDPNPPGKVGTSINDSTLGGCLERKSGICLKYAAVVIDKSRYEACKAFISNPVENIKYAVSLQSKSGWGQWGFNRSCGY